MCAGVGEVSQAGVGLGGQSAGRGHRFLSPDLPAPLRAARAVPPVRQVSAQLLSLCGPRMMTTGMGSPDLCRGEQRLAFVVIGGKWGGVLSAEAHSSGDSNEAGVPQGDTPVQVTRAQLTFAVVFCAGSRPARMARTPRCRSCGYVAAA